MTQLGGSATLFGVLYQLMGTAHWAARIRLATTPSDLPWTDVRLVVEPSGGGGDTRIESSHHRIVEQWKSKSDAGPWSLRKIITDVLPDLYRSIDSLSDDRLTEFRFVTEGHRGRWANAERFFAELAGQALPQDPLAVLDDTESVRFFRDQDLTRLAFFRHILTSLRTHQDIARDSETDCARKLWHLLTHFAIHGDRSAERLVRELDGFLRPLVDYSEQVEPKRRELCAALLELASGGNATFTPQELLAKANLHQVPFCDWSTAREAILQTTQRTLHTRWHYQPEVDVRPLPNLAPKAFVHLLRGGSGKGKTWRLAAIALDAFASGSMAAPISASGDGERDLANAADAVWRTAFQREGPTNLDLLAKKRHEFLPGLPSPWLTLCVDDIQSVAEARSLVERDWPSWGIRLIVTALPPVADALSTQYGAEISIIDVEDFSLFELQEYLELHGHDWSALPSDVRNCLRQPLLAKLYCDIAESGDWRPADEYALFARYWRRIRDHRSQADFPGDCDAMRALASTFLAADVVYPWPQSLCARCGVLPEVQKRLEAVGWLRRLDDDRVEVPHDRLLNWAVAEAMVAKRVARELSPDQFDQTLSRFFGAPSQARTGPMLGYVPMDVCWIMCDPSRNLTGELPRVIASLEDKSSIWRSDGLYKGLLPTLGPRIIPSIVERVRTAAAEVDPKEAHPLPGFLAAAVVEIGRQHPQDAAQWGARLLHEQSPSLQRAALGILKHFPDSSALDKLWQLHKVNSDESLRAGNDRWWIAYQRTFDALRACVRLDHQWLERRITESPQGTEPFSELAYLVANMPDLPGRLLWNRVKAALFAKVPAAKSRCLATCIQQHGDSSEIPRLESWLNDKHDFLANVAFSALVHLAPERALESLSLLSPADLYLTRASWLPGLLLRFPDETRERMRNLVADSTSGRCQAALVCSGAQNEMDAETLGLLLDELQTLVHDALADPSTSGGPRLWHPLSLLADVTRLSLLTVFESRAETPLERDLAALASRWIGRMGIVHDHELEYATAILLKITGPQFTVLVNNQLRSQDKFARLRAIELSLIRPDTETRTLLAQITQLPGSWDDKQPFPLLQTKAAVALAALGQNRDVTQAILRWGTVLSDLPDMRDGQPPMTDDDLAPALDALRSPDEQVRTNAVFALSVSGRADLAPMIRKLLADVPPESDLARAAVIALDHFGDAHPDVLALLERQLTIPSHAYAAALTLLRDGRPSAIAILTQHLQRSGITPGAGASDFLVANLIRRQETSKTVAQLLWKHIQDGGGHWFGLSPNALESLGDLDTPEVRDFLIQEAYAPESALHIEGRKADAIRGLAKFSKDLAFRAAETALRTDRKDLHLYPDLLIALDEPRAIPLLFTVYSPSLPTLAKWAIGRALRRSAGQPIVQSTLVEMMTADFPESRSSGVELAAWLPPSAFADRIRDIAIRDSSSTVRRSAEKAAALVDRQKSAAELLAAIEGSHGPRCWSYLDALVKLSDPWLLNTGNDPLFIWPRLSEKPPGIRSHAWAQIKKRMDDLKKEAEKSDRDAKD